MQTVDFARSFLTFRNDYRKRPAPTASHAPPTSLNNARILLDCVCEIVDKETGREQTFAAGASCKTERVGVERDIWLHPNTDFVPIFSRDRFMIVKTYTVDPDWWSAYIFNSRVRCVNHTVNGADSFKCYGEALNWGPQS